MAQHDAPPRARQAPTSPLSTVVVHGNDISVERAHSELPKAEARSRFGGVDLPALLGGALAGVGASALLAAVAGAVALQLQSVDAQAAGLTALGVSVAVLALSALAGGWVAGRAARYDGARNGLLAGLLLPVLLGLAGLAGGLSAGRDLPASLDTDRLATAALVAAVAGLVLSALAGLLGGRLGARWHRDVDDVLVNTRPGAVTAEEARR